MEFKQIQFDEEFVSNYWDGPSNIIARYYAYLQRGFGVLNDAKYYILAVFGGFLSTDVHMPVLLWVILSLIGFVALIFIGRWHLFKASKAIEFITNRHGSLLGFKPYNIQVEQLRILEEINARLQINRPS